MVTLINNLDQGPIRNICEDFDNAPANLLEILHAVQKKVGYLSDDALVAIAGALNISRAEIHGVVSFYHDYKRTAGAKTVVKICRAEACQAVGGEHLAAYASEKFELKPDTEVKAVYCLGNCALGPAIMIDENLYGRVTPERLSDLVEKHLVLEGE